MATKSKPAAKGKAASRTRAEAEPKTGARKAAARKKSAAPAAATKKAAAKAAPAEASAPGAEPAAEAAPSEAGKERVKLPRNYRPSPKEKYMNPRQLEYFRQKLLAWRESLVEESLQTLEQMREAQRDVSDEAERASRETEISFELRTRDRYRKLLRKIDQALERIEDGTYGYCEETGEPIGIARLEARPIATLSVEAQERREMKEKQYSDRL